MAHTRANQRAEEARQRQSAQLLEDVFVRYEDQLFGTLYYLVGNAEDARDAVQETFVKCWKHRNTVPQVENLRAWIFRIALNTGRDMRTTAWRRRRKPLAEGEASLVSTDHQPEDDAADREKLALVRHAILQLRPQEQEVFLLRQNGQMTYDQIAQSINIPVGTVKTRMRLALSRLREALQSHAAEH